MKKIGTLKTYTSSEIESSYVSIGFEGLDRELFKPEKCYDALSKTGVKYARCITGWCKCEREKGVYDFTWLDEVVDNLLTRGIQPWFIVGFGNSLYMSDIPDPSGVGCVPIYYGEEATQAWDNYIFALVNHYKDRITHYEIWNEPNLTAFWYPAQPSGKEYAGFLNRTSRIIRQVQPNAKIGGCICALYYLDFIKEQFAHFEKGSIDFFCFHAYTTVPEFRYKGLVERMRLLLRESGFPDVELWQGEAGYPSWAYRGHWLVKEGIEDERPQAVYQLRRYFIDVSCGIKRSSFFQIADFWEKPYAKANEVITKPAAHGILNGLTYTPKKSYQTISHLASLFSGDVRPSTAYIFAEVLGESVMELLSCQTMAFEKNGKPFYAYYLPLELGKPITKEYTATVVIEGHIEEPILIDTYTGEAFAIEPHSTSEGMTVFRALPLTDYPLVLADKRTFSII